MNENLNNYLGEIPFKVERVYETNVFGDLEQFLAMKKTVKTPFKQSYEPSVFI